VVARASSFWPTPEVVEISAKQILPLRHIYLELARSDHSFVWRIEMKRLTLLLTIAVIGFVGPPTVTRSNVDGPQLDVKPIPFQTEIEPSAVEPIGTGNLLLVASDKHPDLLIVDAQTGVISEHRLSIRDAGLPNPKWEAMAKDGKDYYLLGADCSCVYRFSLVNEDSPKPALITMQPGAAPLAIKADVKDLLALVEGLAVWVNDNNEKELVFGIREKPGKELIQIYTAKIGDGELSLSKFFAFIAKKPDGQPVEWHLSSLEYVQALNGFFVVTSTEDGSNKFHGNKLWFVSREKLKSSQPSAATGAFKDATSAMIGGRVFNSTMKAEGFAMIDDKQFRVAIVFDNDYRKTSGTAQLAVFNLADMIEVNQVLSNHAAQTSPH
jgi:hypothetical protein